MIPPRHMLALALTWLDRADEGRDLLVGLLDEAGDRGEESDVPIALADLATLECLTGRWGLAINLAEEAWRRAVRAGQPRVAASALHARALVQARRGDLEAARRSATEGLRLAERVHSVYRRLQFLAVLGFIELCAEHHQNALTHFAAIHALAGRSRLAELAVIRSVPDEVEAMIAAGNIQDATELIRLLELEAEDSGRPWPTWAAARCRALLLIAAGDAEGALNAISARVGTPPGTLDPFDLARSLLVRGLAYRKTQQRRLARQSLSESLELFRGLGAEIWVDRARSELGRIGGRTGGSNRLSYSEEKVAALVAAGHRNREVADALYISPKTVDTTLSNIYRKLGIHSRTELVRVWSALNHDKSPEPVPLGERVKQT